MVEGPGCTLNGEKIRSKVETGQTVTEMRGSVTQSRINAGGMCFQSFCGACYSGVETLGKELFLYFGPRALRVHFGMNGSMRINPAEAVARTRTLPPAALQIHLTKDIICFFDVTVETRSSEASQQRVSSMRVLDVCSAAFSAAAAADAVRRQSERMLCDVLLDQSILPGVGNIIKNEALLDAGLHPAVQVGQLTEQQLQHLVKMTRDFTLLFYKCRRSGSPLYKHYKVYKRPCCALCSGVITVCRLGDGGRMTYFCQRCQSADPRQVNVSKLPVRNSLIGWVHTGGTNEHVAKKQEVEWACQRCTLINRPSDERCDACLATRPAVPEENDKGGDEDPGSSTAHLIKYPCNAFRKPPTELRLNWRSVLGTSTLLFSDLSERPAAACGDLPEKEATRTTSPNYAPGGRRVPAGGPEAAGASGASWSRQPAKKMRTDGDATSGNDAADGSAAMRSQPIRASDVPPSCPSHGRPSVLRVVHKDGENKGRRFYCCSLPRETKCNFFQWADLHFPQCHHGKRCLMRTVLKLGPNNGRSFYTCGSRMGKQCQFFQWVHTEPAPGLGC